MSIVKPSLLLLTSPDSFEHLAIDVSFLKLLTGQFVHDGESAAHGD